MYELILDILKMNMFSPYENIARMIFKSLNSKYVIINRSFLNDPAFIIEEKLQIIARAISDEDSDSIEKAIGEIQ